MGQSWQCCTSREDKDVDHQLLGKTNDRRQSALVQDNFGNIDTVFTMARNDKLGEGGYGDVVKGTNKFTGENRAIKIQKKKHVTDPDRFMEEIALMKSLDHANLIRLFEVFEDNKCFYLVMEMCEGGELFDRIMAAWDGHSPEDMYQDGHMEVQTACVMKQLLRAVAYLHKAQVVHRDLKPENVLFVEKVTDKTVVESTIKVIDFGVSAEFTPGTPLHNKVGTMHYMAPDFFKDCGYTELVDIWACGVIMYMMLTFSFPFGCSDDPDNVIRKNAQRGCPSSKLADEQYSHLSADAKDVLKRLLEPDPTKRHSAQTALQEQWIVEHAPNASSKAPSGFASKLQAFQAKTKFMQTTLKMIAWRMEDKRIHQLKDIFEALDENGDGTLTLTEIRAGIKNAHDGSVPEDLQAIIEGVHFDHITSEIDYTEFLAAMLDKKTVMQRDVCWQAFRVYDKNGDGKIQLSELEDVFSCGTIASAMGDQTVSQMISEFDKNGDGELDFEEFMEMMQKVNA